MCEDSHLILILLRNKGWHASYSVISLCSLLPSFLRSLGISRRETVRVRKEPFLKGSGKAKCNELIFSSLLLCAAVTTGQSVYFVNSALLEKPSWIEWIQGILLERK